MSEQSLYRSNIEAERAVLGSVMIDSMAWPSIADIVKAPDFYLTKHSTIFGVMASMVKAGESVDLLTLAARMATDGTLEAAGGMGYLASLMDSVAVTTNVSRYARIVAECAQARTVVEEASELQTAIRDGATPDEIYQAAQRLARKAEPASKGTSLFHAPEMLDHLSRYHDVAADARVKNANGLIVETPWTALNKMFGGGWKGGRRPYVIAAQEKVGKTQVALKVLLHAALNGVPALFFSLELPHVQVTCRMLGLLSGISPSKIQTWITLTPDETAKIIDAWELLGRLPLVVEAKVDRKAAGYKATIATQCNQMVARYERLIERGFEAGIIAIDYAQKMDANAKDERQRFIEVSESIADWSTGISAPVIELAQCLSRGKEQGEPATARDIFGSSQFAKDACCVIIADRPPLRKSDEKRRELSPSELEEASLIVDIEEYGNTGKIDIRHDATNGNWLPAWEEEKPVYSRYTRQDLEPSAYELQGIRWEND